MVSQFATQYCLQQFKHAFFEVATFDNAEGGVG